MTLGQSTAVAMALVSALAIGIWISPFVMEPPVTAEGTMMTATARGEATLAGALTAIPVSSPALHARLRPLLTRGARMELAAEGFQSAEQFAAVAHAAHNTGVPFVLLKHRVLEEGMSLTEAIRTSDATVDADAEADRARAEARSVIATLSATP